MLWTCFFIFRFFPIMGKLVLSFWLSKHIFTSPIMAWQAQQICFTSNKCLVNNVINQLAILPWRLQLMELLRGDQILLQTVLASQADAARNQAGWVTSRSPGCCGCWCGFRTSVLPPALLGCRVQAGKRCCCLKGFRYVLMKWKISVQVQKRTTKSFRVLFLLSPTHPLWCLGQVWMLALATNTICAAVWFHSSIGGQSFFLYLSEKEVASLYFPHHTPHPKQKHKYFWSLCLEQNILFCLQWCVVLVVFFFNWLVCLVVCVFFEILDALTLSAVL